MPYTDEDCLVPFDHRYPAARVGRYAFISDDQLQEAPTISSISRPLAPAAITTTCAELLGRFLADQDLYAVPVVDAAGRPLYLVDRGTFVEFFAKPFTREIFGRRAIERLMTSDEYHCPAPLIVEHTSTLEDVAQIIISAGMHHMVNGVLVTSDDSYLGVANGHDLLEAITRRKQAELFYLAHYDHLTGVPNRALLGDRLQQACREADRHQQMVALLFIDVDRFKQINDSLGHSCGDAVLRILVNRLKGAARQMDTVARLGGDEFVILMENLVDPTHAQVVAERVLNAMQTPVEVLGHVVRVTVSIGVAIYPNDDRESSRLLAKADSAMYEAKAAGRNGFRSYSEDNVAFDPGLLSMEHDLRLAISDNQLMLHFQPQVQIATQRIRGVEALVRWQHPSRGMVSPMEFIPLAEKCGMIAPLGEWVLRTACRQLREWQIAGLPPIRMSVNVSAVQFNQRDFIPTLQSVIEHYGIDPGHLELELTESVLMQNVDDALTTLRAIRALGVSLAIDDFGTGFSSLNYLRLFPINRLKIDQSFIRNIGQTPANASITRAIIALAASLSLDIVAEGIESSAEKSVLESLGCAEGQGYLFARPLTAADATSWIIDNARPGED
jgi:diguanylate cyclase (GGDEF)-like protein